jgi:hypothetical protein
VVVPAGGCHRSRTRLLTASRCTAVSYDVGEGCASGAAPTRRRTLPTSAT